MTSVEDIFRAFGGAGPLAAALDIRLPVAESWRKQGAIPTVFWRRLTLEATRRRIEITPDILLKAHEHKPGAAV